MASSEDFSVRFNNFESLLNFMYQDEVDVTKQDLSSFSEVAEDINVRELSERNMENIDSRDDIFRFIKGNPYPSPKCIRNLEQIVDNNSVEEIIITRKVGDNVDDNDNNTRENFALADIESKDNKQVCTENAKKNDISTMVVKHLSCEKCNKMFSSRDSLRRHVHSIHERISYLCNQCDYKATRKESVSRHVKSIHQVDYKVKSVHEGKRYPCDKCDYKTTIESNLSRHIKSIHEGERYLCDQCDCNKVFSRRDKLRRHVQTIHEGIYYLCNQCDYKATQKENLSRHVKSIHEGERYLCSQCDYKATRKDSLSLHVKSIHERKH